jgi:hypothetical protein
VTSPDVHPVCKYFGSKWHASAHYPTPRYPVIVEPFAGSACYSLRHYKHHTVLVDKDPDVADLWDYLLHVDVSEILALPTDLEIGSDIRKLPVSRGAQLLIRNWQRVGRSTCWTVSKWCGANGGMWSEAVKRRLAITIPKIRHWNVWQDSYELLDNVHATWFVDAPYQHVAPSYAKGCNEVDYNHLAWWCRTRKGQVIVCEQEGADWLPFRKFRDLKAGCAGTRVAGRVDKGVIWTND